jgi:hypothetical protein
VFFNCPNFGQFIHHLGDHCRHRRTHSPTNEGDIIVNKADATRAELFGLLEHLERLANERLGITNEPEPEPAPPGKTAKRLAEFDAMSDEKQIAKLLELFR